MLTPQIIDSVVRAALAEDAPWGDITTELLIPVEARATANLVAREGGVFSGGAVFRAVFGAAATAGGSVVGNTVAVSNSADSSAATSSAISVTLLVVDGDRFEAGAVLASVTGSARTVLTAERVALNLVQRMSGIATLTAQYVALVEGTAARIVDTRKTTPGLRALERHAVRSGGGHNHRFSLSDAVMAKDNHLAVLMAHGGLTLTEALLQVRAQLSHTTHFEVEVDRADQIEPVLAGGVDTIMLDNFTLEELREGVELVAHRAIVEASGNVNLTTVAAIAATGVDVISVGALTHSVRALDLGLDVVVDVAVPTPARTAVTPAPTPTP
ncbi:nicotinate-nucleotide pyrophosphorylase [carboxylating] [Glaciihabitans tibetensis]|uniref:Nicotinate-nucleotide pyrophosphorylase [carboxylating] n=1 Tax=Glaciihabitans tibetensis TaxID=1266600 RepID=A0A2T0VD88_9MICO|nr:carboxylating nicotinate-nucleotide diphosphorylase [Glaciihabitans tibetensis]PRY68123.1 nicotinate-nucleotide pyrophosphorylase [carboxylating] [Glaciihabitans tibetensis]